MALSHLFYLPRDSKLLFLTIKDGKEEEEKVVVFSLSSNLLPTTRTMVKQLLSSPAPPGTRLTITHLKAANVHDKAVLRSSRQTSLTISDDILPLKSFTPSSLELVTYRGIVTKAGEAGDGVHTLDKRVILVSSLLCIATSLPHLPLGAVVIVHRAHCLQWRGQRVLLLCGASRSELSDIFRGPLIHCVVMTLAYTIKESTHHLGWRLRVGKRCTPPLTPTQSAWPPPSSL